MKTIETSIKSLMKQIESGKLKSDKAKILNYAYRGPFTMVDVMDELHYTHPTASGRIADLLDLGLLRPMGTRYIGHKDSEYNLYTLVTDKDTQRRLQRERKREKYNQWKKRGMMQFGDFLEEDGISLTVTSKEYKQTTLW